MNSCLPPRTAYSCASVHNALARADNLEHIVEMADKAPEVPHSIASTAPRRSSIAAISVGRVRIASRASACVTPRADQVVVLAPSVLVGGIVFETGRDHNHCPARSAAPNFDSAADHVVTPDEHGSREAFVDNDLRRAQNPSSSPSAKATRFCAGSAQRIPAPCWHRIDTYARHALAIGFQICDRSVATPLSIAALATAGATRSMRRGSNGVGIK